ncbi:MAG TPA: NUDIX hydrolase [Chitinophagaceae bacterium]|nr:NUDIX hydrolase [Chitinophagaceae bacterium]
MFNLRVYGLLINEQQEVLVSDELIRGNYITKFPGGGLEFGEGSRDCLIREFMEELDLRIEVTEHIYTTDYFQISAFNPQHQIISIYYFVKAMEPIKVQLNDSPFQFTEAQQKRYQQKQEIESFRFIPLNKIKADDVTLPIDKIVVELLSSKIH